MSSQDVEVSRDPEQNRYELHVDGRLAGRAEYLLSNGLITFTHPEVDPTFEGRGFASKLVQYALDDVRDAGDRKVLAVCPYVKQWIRRHKDYVNLLYDAAE